MSKSTWKSRFSSQYLWDPTQLLACPPNMCVDRKVSSPEAKHQYTGYRLRPTKVGTTPIDPHDAYTTITWWSCPTGHKHFAHNTTYPTPLNRRKWVWILSFVISRRYSIDSSPLRSFLIIFKMFWMRPALISASPPTRIASANFSGFALRTDFHVGNACASPMQWIYCLQWLCYRRPRYAMDIDCLDIHHAKPMETHLPSWGCGKLG